MQANIELQSKMKERFYAILFSKDSKYNSALLMKEKYDSIIEDIKRIKGSKKKNSSRDYRIIEKYDMLTIQGCEKLIYPLSDSQQNVKKYVHADELFEILYSTHVSIGHGGRDRMVKELNTLYKNITQSQIKMFLNVCEHCQQKQKSEKKGIVVKPIISSHFNSRCQVDLIDYQSQPDGKFKFLLVYQDHLTKFVVLRPLTSKRADEVAYHLLDIFLLLGAPCILHSDNGREFCNRVLQSLNNMWPELKMVHGKPRHSQSQGSVERANQDIENMLTTWMADNQTNKWSEGVRFVQFMKNRAFHSGIQRSPYEAMFGGPAKVGLASSIIPQEILHSLHKEEDLEDLDDADTDVAKNTPLQSSLIQTIEDSNMVSVQDQEDEITETLTNTNEPFQLQSTDHPVQETHMDNKSPLTNELTKDNSDDTVVQDPVISDQLPSENQELAEECINSNIAPTHNEQVIESLLCVVCSKETSGAHTCIECNLFVHAICGDTESEEGYGKKILCKICKNNMIQRAQREKAKEGLEKQARKMISVSDANHPIAEEGTTVRIKIPEVDRSKTDARSILAIVLEISDDGLYKLGTKSGVLKQLYARSQFSVCQERLIAKDDVPDVEISLRQTATKQSISHGQGFRKCDCKSKCATNRCACRKNFFLCNSKCHQSLDCTNK